MPLYSLTWEKVQALQAEAAEQQALVARLHQTTAAAMWSEDLDAFLKVFNLIHLHQLNYISSIWTWTRLLFAI